MTDTPEPQWIAACTQRLQQHWRTVDAAELEHVAVELWHEPRLRHLAAAEAAAEWLRPIEPYLQRE